MASEPLSPAHLKQPTLNNRWCWGLMALKLWRCLFWINWTKVFWRIQIVQYSSYMDDILLWSSVLSLFIKMIIHIKMDQSGPDFFERYLSYMKMLFFVFLPIRKNAANQHLSKIGNICLIIFYVSFLYTIVSSISHHWFFLS